MVSKDAQNTSVSQNVYLFSPKRILSSRLKNNFLRKNANQIKFHTISPKKLLNIFIFMISLFYISLKLKRHLNKYAKNILIY